MRPRKDALRYQFQRRSWQGAERTSPRRSRHSFTLGRAGHEKKRCRLAAARAKPGCQWRLDKAVSPSWSRQPLGQSMPLTWMRQHRESKDQRSPRGNASFASSSWMPPWPAIPRHPRASARNRNPIAQHSKSATTQSPPIRSAAHCNPLRAGAPNDHGDEVLAIASHPTHRRSKRFGESRNSRWEC